MAVNTDQSAHGEPLVGVKATPHHCHRSGSMHPKRSRKACISFDLILGAASASKPSSLTLRLELRQTHLLQYRFPKVDLFICQRLKVCSYGS